MVYRLGPTQSTSGSYYKYNFLKSGSTDLCLDGLVIFCIPLYHKVQDRLFVLMLQQPVHNKRQSLVPLHHALRNVFQNQDDSNSGLLSIDMRCSGSP